MYFQVVRMYDRGVKKDSEALLCEVPELGDLHVAMAGGEALKREAMVAVLRRGGTEQDLVPPLLDAKLQGMAGAGFTLVGLEQEGEQFFMQAWYCREVED